MPAALLLLALLASPAAAQMMGGYPSSNTMQGMMDSMLRTGAAPSSVDCARLTDADFERFGDEWMQRMLDDRELHERMDQAMGPDGERVMHRMMGRSLTSCLDGYSAQGMMPMMMWMTPAMVRAYGGAGYYGLSVPGQDILLWLTGLNTLLLAAVLFVLLTGGEKRSRR